MIMNLNRLKTIFLVGLHPQVRQYLEEHSVKSLSHKSCLLSVSRTGPKNRNLRRRMSVRGAVKKTRSINVDCEYTFRLIHFLYIVIADIFTHLDVAACGKYVI